MRPARRPQRNSLFMSTFGSTASGVPPPTGSAHHFPVIFLGQFAEQQPEAVARHVRHHLGRWRNHQRLRLAPIHRLPVEIEVTRAIRLENHRPAIGGPGVRIFFGGGVGQAPQVAQSGRSRRWVADPRDRCSPGCRATAPPPPACRRAMPKCWTTRCSRRTSAAAVGRESRRFADRSASPTLARSSSDLGVGQRRNSTRPSAVPQAESITTSSSDATTCRVSTSIDS